MITDGFAGLAVKHKMLDVAVLIRMVVGNLYILGIRINGSQEMTTMMSRQDFIETVLNNQDWQLPPERVIE